MMLVFASISPAPSLPPPPSLFLDRYEDMTSNPVNLPHCFQDPVVSINYGAELYFKLIYNPIGPLV